MDEKTMVNDALSGIKAELSGYQTAISETENMALRQTFQQLRNDSESFQYELFKVAKNKGYYSPAAEVDMSEVQKVKNEFQC